MSTHIAIFEFKCRRCSEIDATTVTGANTAGVKLVNTITGLNPDPMLPLVSAHRCEDGGEGVTDLIGYRVDERSNQ